MGEITNLRQSDKQLAQTGALAQMDAAKVFVPLRQLSTANSPPPFRGG
jgi:hypothetical protein